MLGTHLTLALLTIGGAAPAALPASLAPLPHVRPLDPLAADLLATGSRGSSTFAGLVDALDRAAGLVVYVTTTSEPDHRGSIVFVSRAADITYLLIRVHTRQTDSDRVAVLAHEMTHAVEIARAGLVMNEHDLQRLYVCIGIDSSGRHLESAAAVRAERAVHHEIGRLPDQAEVDLTGSSSIRPRPFGPDMS
jgi:hypothetical protein